jgi:hypothetical protein
VAYPVCRNAEELDTVAIWYIWSFWEEIGAFGRENVEFVRGKRLRLGHTDTYSCVWGRQVSCQKVGIVPKNKQWEEIGAFGSKWEKQFCRGSREEIGAFGRELEKKP